MSPTRKGPANWLIFSDFIPTEQVKTLVKVIHIMNFSYEICASCINWETRAQYLDIYIKTHSSWAEGKYFYLTFQVYLLDGFDLVKLFRWMIWWNTTTFFHPGHPGNSDRYSVSAHFTTNKTKDIHIHSHILILMCNQLLFSQIRWG